MTDILTAVQPYLPIIGAGLGLLSGHQVGTRYQIWKNRFNNFVNVLDKIRDANADDKVTPEEFTGILNAGIALTKS